MSAGPGRRGRLGRRAVFDGGGLDSARHRSPLDHRWSSVRGKVATIDRSDLQGVGVVVGEVVDDPGLAGVHLAAAEVLGADHLAGRRLHQRRTAEEDRALLLDDHGLVRHRRHVGATGGARAHHRRDLRDAVRRQVGLVEEDPAEVLLVREHLVLHRQERAAGVDEVEARQPVRARDLLGAQVLLDGDRVVGAALHRRVVGHHDAVAALDPADAGDDAGAGHRVVVHARTPPAGSARGTGCRDRAVRRPGHARASCRGRCAWRGPTPSRPAGRARCAGAAPRRVRQVRRRCSARRSPANVSDR